MKADGGIDMNRPGHVGLSLLVLSPFMKTLGVGFVAVATVFTLAPDIDLVLRIKHRAYTHNVTFAVFMALLAAAFTTFFGNHSNVFAVALAAFTGVVIHVIADLMTIQKFPPLYPFSGKKVAFKLFRSDNAAINSSAFIAGVFSFLFFISKIGGAMK